MKNSTKRILMSVLTLVLTVVALGTTTFAWFSIGNISTVTGVEANVQAGDGLEIQLKGTTYESDFKNNLVAADWNAFMAADAAGFKFAAVTSTDGVAFRELAQRADGGLGLANLTGAANQKYLEFDINFRSLQPGYVNLTALSFGGGVQAWTPSGITSYLQFAGQNTALPVDAFAKNAARISFTHTSTQVFQEPELAYSNSDAKITGNHFQGATGVLHGQWDYLAKRGVIIWNAATDGAVISDPTTQSLFAAKATNSATLSADVGNIALTPNGTYYEGTVTVRIWIEGWDADAYDSIFNTLLEVNLTFQKTTTTP